MTRMTHTMLHSDCTPLPSRPDPSDQISISDRFTISSSPAIRAPSVDPVGENADAVGRVGEDLEFVGVFESDFQCFVDCLRVQRRGISAAQ